MELPDEAVVVTADPRPLLDDLGVPWDQVTSPTYGYTGSYTPQCAFLHWTASSPSSDTAASVVAGRHYHACVARNGRCALGGWAVRQGHGGEGRTQPLDIARRGAMTLTDIRHWQTSVGADNTDSWPNQYGIGICIDNSGVGEVPPDVQYRNFVATAAAFLVANGLGPAAVIDHASSTNRKIDITAVVPVLDPSKWLADIATYHAMLTNPVPTPPEPVMNTAVDFAVSRSGKGYVVLARDGGVFAYGDITYRGGTNRDPKTGRPYTTSPPVAIGADPDGDGYWILVEDGGVFSFNAPFHGSAVHDMNP